MPGIVSHYAFGLDVYQELSAVIGNSRAETESFLLGNQGPDPLFYLKATVSSPELRGIGSAMHQKRTPKLLDAMHERLIAGQTNGEPQRAYALGFLCHYLLDSTVHPLVYAQQDAICKVPLQKFTKTWANRVVHATIETAIDECLLTTRFDTTAALTPPHKTMLKCPPWALLKISQEFREVIRLVYDAPATETTFMSAVALNRMGQMELDSTNARLRRAVDLLSKSSPVAAYLKSLSHRPESLNTTAFMNDEHVPWPHPALEGETVDASFSDLCAQALEAALRFLPAYAEPSIDPGLCSDIVGDVNFLGKPVEQ